MYVKSKELSYMVALIKEDTKNNEKISFYFYIFLIKCNTLIKDNVYKILQKIDKPIFI
jgi:hypothetical protein